MIIPVAFRNSQPTLYGCVSVSTEASPDVVYRKEFPDHKELDVVRWEVPFEVPKDANGKPFDFGPGAIIEKPDHAYRYRFEYISAGATKVLGEGTVSDFPQLHPGMRDVITIFDSKLLANEAVFLEKDEGATELRCYEDISSAPHYAPQESLFFLKDEDFPKPVFIISGALTADTTGISSVELTSYDHTVKRFVYTNDKWDPPLMVLPALPHSRSSK